MGTRRYLISKVLQAVLTLLFVLVFNFFLFRGLGDPTQLLAKQRGSLTPAAGITAAPSRAIDATGLVLGFVAIQFGAVVDAGSARGRTAVRITLAEAWRLLLGALLRARKQPASGEQNYKRKSEGRPKFHPRRLNEFKRQENTFRQMSE